MIDITKLTFEDVGRPVVYTAFDGKLEEGTISSWNDEYIFVRYRGPDAAATSPRDLHWKEES